MRYRNIQFALFRLLASKLRALLALAWFALLFLPPAFARTSLDLDERFQPIALLDWGDSWIDPTGRKNIKDVSALAQNAFVPTGQARRYQLQPNEALWIRFGVPSAPDDKRWYLKLMQPGLERVDLYSRGADGDWTVQKAGDQLPVADWPLPNVFPVFPLRVSAEEPTYYALRIEASRSFQLPITFENESGLSSSLQQASLLHGFYFGLLMMVASFSFCTAIAMREPTHALFGLWATALTLVVAGTLGAGGMHLWPKLAGWNMASRVVLPVMAMALLLVFTSAATSLKARKPWLHYGVLLLALVMAAVAALAFRLESRMAVQFAVAACATAAVVCCAATIWVFLRGDRFAGWLLLGFMPLVLALMLLMAHTSGWLATSLLIRHAQELAVGITVPFIFLLLMLRGQERRNYQSRISQIDRVDPATGLVNDLVFVHRLRGMIERSDRLEQQCAVVVIDIANRATLLEQYGRRDCLKVTLKLAGRLSTMLRDVDTVARLGEARFGLLIEGPIPVDRVNSMATKIFARCIAPFAGLPMGLVLKPKIAVILAPKDAETAEYAIELLDKILLGAAPDSRKNIFISELSG